MNAIPGRCPGLACAAPLALKTGGGEDVDHLAFGGDGLAHELADGGVRGSANAEVRSPKFSQFDIPNSSFDISHSVALSATARWMS